MQTLVDPTQLRHLLLHSKQLFVVKLNLKLSLHSRQTVRLLESKWHLAQPEGQDLQMGVRAGSATELYWLGPQARQTPVESSL